MKKENVGANISPIESKFYKITKGGFTGTAAGILMTAVGHPFDTLKVRLQVQTSGKDVYNGLIDCFVKTLKWEGPLGLYKGVGAPLTGQLFLRCTLFTSYFESLELLIGNKSHPEGTMPYFIAGAFSGICGSFAESPFELVNNNSLIYWFCNPFKSKMQIQIIREKTGLPLETNYKNVFHVGRYISSNYGLRGVFQGFAPITIRNMIGYSVFFGSSELIKRMLLEENETLDTINFYKIVIGGAIGGILFWTITFNFDVIKSAMMADHIEKDKRAFKGVYDCGRKLMLNEGGYMRLWKGFTPCLMRSAPANGLQLLVVDFARKIFPPYEKFKAYNF